MTRLFLVRHGETDWNIAGRLQGRRDIALNALGRSQAAQVGRVLSQLAGDVRGFSFVSSPLLRAIETMRILRTTLDLPAAEFAQDGDLAELSFGRWEGLTWPEVRHRFPTHVRARDREPWTFVPPEGESYADLSARAAAAVARLPGEAVVVTHGGVIRALLHAHAGMPQSEATLVPVRQGAVYVLAGGRFRVAE
ncbi:histidine phosphatase family protein [Aquabacter spiritensis]|uniref:Putative phosphoglycerate mutase n=1 Tax=Aquabacter spiritensis TaxID=933073 RepID=A0A4R3M4R3_9HYPH|nr:histidine phosphatase family protein [Aquabacter spiritensis]TCT07573.1 putative phosphoglycerate mutase [Aquabacter spiritensis]